MESRFGNFDEGKEADFLVIEPADGLKAMLENAVRSDDPMLARDQTLFGLPMGIRESSVALRLENQCLVHSATGSATEIKLTLAGFEPTTFRINSPELLPLH